jgi:pimeloyl-ACP methyl ester carboxylesterase
MEALDLPEVTVQGRLAVPLRHAVAVAADRYSFNGRLTKLFIAICFPEVVRYLAGDDAPARTQAREHVAATIAERRARVVIAHSLGTIVTYEALHAHPDLKVDLLITLGSPLALPGAVFPRLHPRPSGGTGQRPANVGRWVNISDYGDPIAILRPFKSYFPDVNLDLTESVGLFDFHRAARYLASASLAATLQPLLE